MKRLVLVLALLLSLPIAAQSRIGRITGTVFNKSGDPVSKATAYAMNLEGNSGPLPQALTDASGHFVIARLFLGSYTVYASKEDAGYPPSYDLFYSGFEGTFPEVTIDQDDPSADVSIGLGKRAGWLSGSVLDDATGKVTEACSEFRWKNDSRISGGGRVSEKFRVLVPSLTPITLKVWIWGYQPWFYRSEDGDDSLSFRPGQELHIKIRLKRSQPKRAPTDDELRAMKKTEETGCSTPVPPDKTD